MSLGIKILLAAELFLRMKKKSDFFYIVTLTVYFVFLNCSHRKDLLPSTSAFFPFSSDLEIILHSFSNFFHCVSAYLNAVLGRTQVRGNGYIIRFNI